MVGAGQNVLRMKLPYMAHTMTRSRGFSIGTPTSGVNMVFFESNLWDLQGAVPWQGVESDS